MNNKAFIIAFLALTPVAWAQSLDGRWSATIVRDGLTVPFRLDIAGQAATLYNGSQDMERTTSATIGNGKAELSFEQYLAAIHATLKDGALDGEFVSYRKTATPLGFVPFHAVRYTPPAAADLARIPKIDGDWVVPVKAGPEGARRLIVKQSGAEIETTILRVDGDTGGATGSWENGKFVASHFDGARPIVITLTPNPDGTLGVSDDEPGSSEKLIAYRPDVAREKGLGQPADYTTFTRLRDPNAVFTFRFPDTHGKIQSNEDPQYKGKVVLAVVTGTWCPNCHDEAKLLVELYAKYHARGLKIVALDFEEPDQQSTLRRVNAFIRQYRVPYPYLIAGAPDEIGAKLPQIVNLETWPATFFIGRDGQVKATHAGFAGPSAGNYYAQLRSEFNSNIERLLAERAK
jgi:peroxiredoxin